MIFPLFKRYGNYTSALLVAVIVSVGILSIANFGMDMPMGDKASDCPFFGATHSMCAVSPFAHIALWQGLSTAIMPQLILPLLALFVALFVLAYVATLFFRALNAPPLRLAYRAVYSLHLPPTSLQEAFSKGILNPKLF